MLERLKLLNFKSHKDTEFNFDDSRLYALVGQNSSGKTSVLQSLRYLGMLTNSSAEQVFEYDRSPESIITSSEKSIFVTASGFYCENDNRKSWKLFYGWEKISNHDWVFTMSWNIDGEQDRWEGKRKILKSKKYKDRGLIKYPSSSSKFLKHSAYLKLVASKLAKAAYSNEIKPSLEFDGSGLAPTLDFLRNEDPEKFQLLEERLIRVVPNVRKIGIRRAKVPVIRQRLIEVDGKSISYDESQEMGGQEIVLDMNTGERIPAHAISEGTMLTLGLLTVLMYPEQPNLVLLDDIEQGLHPKAQRELMKVFKEIIQENKNLQIIFTTHSPYILDELEPSQVHILHNNSSGFTVAKRLDEHPDVEWAKQTLTTGEFWDAEGEEWVVEGAVSD